MAKFQIGHKMSKGRAVGSVNKRTAQFVEVLQARNFDIPTSMLDLYEICLKRFVEELDKQDRGIMSPMESAAPKYMKMCSDLLIAMSGYAYPKLKAIEQVKPSITEGMTPEQRLEAMKQYVAALEAQIKK